MALKKENASTDGGRAPHAVRSRDARERDDDRARIGTAVTGAPVAPGALLALQRLAGNHAVAGALQASAGQPVQRKPGPQEEANAPDTPTALQPRTPLEVEFNGNYALATQAVVRLWDSTGGVVGRQQQAVRDFVGEGGAGTDASPSLAQTVIVGAADLALKLALGGVGGAISSFLDAKAVKRVEGTESQLSVGAVAIATALLLTKGLVEKTMDAGRDRATAFIRSSASGNLPQATALAQFGRAQEDALNAVGIDQGKVLLQQMAAVPKAQRWVVAQALHDALEASLQRVYEVQRDSMTDTWFTSQIDTVGLGARPGLLNVELEDVFADYSGRLRVKSGNLLGSGSNETVRAWIAERTLGEIGIPKIITMNGSLGHGLQDHKFDINVWARAREQRMSNDPVSRFMGGDEQRITRVGGTRWGPTWLAAYHLELRDLDRDDPRVTSANIMAGAHKVWDNIKDRSISSLGGSVDHSTW